MTETDPLVRLIVGLLRWLLPAATAEDVIGDLLEQYGRPRRWRRTWLIAGAANLAWGLGRPRSHVPAPPRRLLLGDIWVRDVRYAFRSLFRSRGFAAVGLTSLALGVGLTTAVFSAVNGVLLRPLPYGDADAIVRIREVAPGRPPGGDEVPRPLLRAWVASRRTLEALGPYARTDTRIVARGGAFVGVTIHVGDRFFDVLRTTPLHGRLFGRGDSDPGAPMVAILSHAFWRSAFGADPAAIGRRVIIDDRPADVVGVVREEFTYPSPDAAVYVPGRWRWPEADSGVARAVFGPPLEVLGRLAAGASPSDAEQEAMQLSAQLARRPPGAPPLPAVQVVRLQDDLVKNVRPALVVLLVSVACVLAIVCVNLTNLLLARGTARQREIAIRAALGASRWDMTRPLVLEGLLLSAIGGGAGLGVASILMASLPLTSSVDPMLAGQVRIDARVLAFTLALTACIGIVVSTLPAWLAPAAQVKEAVSGGRVRLIPGAAVRAEQLRSGLVVVQVALAVVLAVGAALLSRSVVTLLTVDLGFSPEQALSVQVRLPPDGGSTFGWRARFYESFLSRLSSHPGVRAAGFTTSLPMHETFSQSLVRSDDVASSGQASPPQAHRETVTPGYFTAIGLPVTTGRGILPADTAASERVLVVNEAFIAVFLPGRDPIGRRVMQFGEWFRIVGVVASKRHAGLRSAVRPEFYTALAQSPPDVVSQSGAGVVVRGSGEPSDLLPFVRSTLKDLQPQAALENEAALADRIWKSTAEPRFYATVMGVFATLALVTALVGLFGVLSYIVERRRVEIGLRRALGATGSDISTLVLGKGVRLVALAVPIGFAGAIAGTGLLRNLLFGIEPADPATFAAVLVGVPVVALAACAWPARRAARIEPLDALRED